MNNSITIFGFEIYYYAIIMASSLLIGFVLAKKEWLKQGLDEEVFNNLIFYLVVFGFIGARTWYVLFSGNLDMYLSHPFEIINLRAGGLAIHGGILGGLLTIIYFAKKYKIPLLAITDIGVVSLIFGQALGRWGNFFNQEAHGPITSLEFLQSLHLPPFIIEGMHIGANYYQPTFLYESCWNLIGFVFMLIIRPKIRNIKGLLTGFYLMWYGFIRIWIESLRTDALYFGSIKVAQLTSGIMLVAGIILTTIIIINYRKEQHENRN